MRIGLALHGWPPEAMGGTGLYVEALARALHRAGHTPLLLAPGAPGEGLARVALDRHRIQGHTVGGRRASRWEHTWAEPDAEGLAARWLDERRLDVLHIHHLSGLPWRLAQAARARGVRVVLTLHDYALPCARGQLVDREGRICAGPSPETCAWCISEQLSMHPVNAWLGRALGALPRVKGVARGVVARSPGERGAARALTRIEAARALVLGVDVLLAPSRDLAARFTRLGFGSPLPVELPLLRPVPPAPPPGEGPLRILFASAILPTKGPHRLLEAFRGLPPGVATLSVAGPTPAFDGAPGFAERLRAAVEATEGARWLGSVAPTEVPALLARHDLLVLPSLWPENSPLVVREASAAGLRLVLPAEGGAAELDPAARLVPSRWPDDGELLRALRSEVEAGRGRRPPRRWPTPEEHVGWLLDRVYARPRQTS